jgi:colanic acid biosynthesis protein WcaH
MNKFEPMRLSDAEFRAAVRTMPLVSIDLVLVNEAGMILLGLRRNEPAKGMYFVPGGRILKNETTVQASLRISVAEVGVKYDVTLGKKLGVFDQIYNTNFFDEPAFGTHYIAMAFLLHVRGAVFGNMGASQFAQHSEYEWMAPRQAIADSRVHKYTKEYLTCL